MKLADYLDENRIVILKGTTKVSAMEEMIGVLSRSTEHVTRDELEAAVWERESLMSTGIGQGLAFPHVRIKGLKDASVCVGVSKEGIDDYESLDGEPVNIMVLIAAPLGQHELYIRLLASVANFLKDPEIRRGIIEAGDPGGIFSILMGGGQ